ncbi:hypothetical protein CYY_006048 [Polysphondylium violaceum]|uniref:TLDc domain-containing protein n=1 Tax=Polysphondylium violaceum TaxID=133409 RepID=A0A8J4URR9_9MYCE|nr:hypothetical protein CYY_006048 [Polysphondylium violaceum]
MVQCYMSNTREDLEKDNERLQKENWELRNNFKVGFSNSDLNSFYAQLKTSNNENDRLKQENKDIKHQLEKLSEENDNHNNKMDLLLNKIESLANLNDKLKTEIENVNQENKKNVFQIENYSKMTDLMWEKIESLNIKIENFNQQLNQQRTKQTDLKNQQHYSMEKKVSLTKPNESLNQQLIQQNNSLNSKLNEQNLGKIDKVSILANISYVFIYPLNSKIIECSSFKIINDWIDDSKTMGFELLYEALENKFSPSSFHSACDGKGATITLIKTTDGCVFGGYNSQSWNSDIVYYGDNKCFIFTMVNIHGIKPTKYGPGAKCTNYVRCSLDSGPIFGSGNDIAVGTKEGSYQSFPWTYADTTGKGKSTLTPTKSFTIKTIEIYKCV